MSGRNPLRNGAWATCWGRSILRRDETTMAQVFAHNDYRTGMFGKWHLGGTGDKPVPVERRGGYHDYWLAADLLEFTSSPYGGGYYDADNRLVPFQGYRVDSQTDHVLEYLRAWRQDRPFFLYVAFNAPHFPFQGPGDADRVEGVAVCATVPAVLHEWRDMLTRHQSGGVRGDGGVNGIAARLQDIQSRETGQGLAGANHAVAADHGGPVLVPFLDAFEIDRRTGHIARCFLRPRGVVMR